MAQKYIVLAIFVVAYMHQTDALSYLENSNNDMFNEIVNLVEEKEDQIQTIYYAFSGNISEKIKNFLNDKETIRQCNQLMENITDVIDENKISSLNCFKTFKEYRGSYKLVMRNISSCFISKINSDLKRFDKTIELVKSIREQLHDLKEEAIQCRDNGSGVLGGVRCMSMKSISDVKPLSIVIEELEHVVPHLDEVSNFVDTWNPDTARCPYEETFKEKIHPDMIARVKNCLKN